jgi:hypothetical protein
MVTRQEVQVVGGAVDRDRRAAQVLQDAPDERVQPLLHFGRDRRETVFGAEDGVVEILCP